MASEVPASGRKKIMTTLVANRQTPWARLGKSTGDAMSAQDAIVNAGLDWEVDTRSLFVSLAGDRRKKIENRRAVVRTDTDDVLGIVGLDYYKFQNREAFSFADSLIDDGQARFTDAGGYRHGKVVFLTMKLGEQILVGGEDAHDLYVVLRTSHDGSKAISVAVTPIRARCANTVALALREAKQRWSMRHTTKLEGKLTEARETLKLSYSYAEEFKQLGETMMQKQVTDDLFQEIVTDMLPDLPRTEQVVDEIMGLYRESETNGYHGTAWGGLNALTEYFEHGRSTRSGEAVFSSIMDGRGARMRDQLTQALLSV